MNTIDNIIGEENIFIYEDVIKKGGELEISPYILVTIFILAIITFLLIYFTNKKENAKPYLSGIEECIKNLKLWILDKIDAFFAYLHIDGEMVKKSNPIYNNV